MRSVDVVVIGAGQAGLSAAYHLQRRGFVPANRAAERERSFIVLDAELAPAGAWQHRWATLKMGTVNGIHELPGFPVPPADPEASSRDVLPAYFAEYERRFALDVQHPVRVRAVRRVGSFEPADVILWATGFRAEIAHLSPLGLRTPEGGIRVFEGRSLDEPRLFVIGYGASQSTVGANRAGRDAVRAIVAEERDAPEARRLAPAAPARI